VERGGQQRTLAGVADAVDAAHLGIGLLAVGGGVDISPTGQHQAVEHVDDLVRSRLGAVTGCWWRHQQGAAAGAATSSK